MPLYKINLSVKETNEMLSWNEYKFIRILHICYVRDKRLYRQLKKDYEILFHKEFNEEEVFYLE